MMVYSWQGAGFFVFLPGMKSKALILALAACAPMAAALFAPAPSSASVARSEASGLSGAALASYVADRFRPSTLPDSQPAAWWADADTRMAIVPAEWWYADAPTDAYNELLGPAALATARGAYIPGDVTRVNTSGTDWAVGVAALGSTEVNAWMPAADRRGDLARRLMYLALMYPQRLWRSHGAMLLEDGGWPLLRPAGKDLLLRWHHDDPVDERERTESAQQGQRQGNLNPFVEYPLLAEYLWGEHAGEEFQEPLEPDVPDVPDVPEDPDVPSAPTPEPVPLKAAYSVAADSLLWFTSPYVPSDAEWTIDRVTATADRMSLSELGVGIHEITFSSSVDCGALKIEIRP